MQRPPNVPSRPPAVPASENPASKTNNHALAAQDSVGSFWDMLGIRIIFTAICVAAGFHFRPFSVSKEYGSFVGALFAVAVILFELRLRRASLRRLIGAATGSILGIVGAYFTTLVLSHTSMPESTRSFFSLATFLVMAYIGLILGANKGDMLNLQALGGLFGSERSLKHSFKVLDTSVIIDGRVADIADAQFLDGTVIIPQFVLHELQLVADSADPLKRQRGRRGLEVLQRIQKMAHLEVHISDDDFPHVPEVDLKLIELAKRYDAKIVTNDYNLNKVATLQGIEILNVNQLANALKPVVLPGETMVVVDGARKMINKTIDITVTSVHQTTAGKMIFGRYDERGEQQVPRATAQQQGAPHGEPPSAPRANEGAAPGGERPARPLYPDTGRS